jgi:hypothetical protein
MTTVVTNIAAVVRLVDYVGGRVVKPHRGRAAGGARWQRPWARGNAYQRYRRRPFPAPRVCASADVSVNACVRYRGAAATGVNWSYTCHTSDS